MDRLRGGAHLAKRGTAGQDSSGAGLRGGYDDDEAERMSEDGHPVDHDRAATIDGIVAQAQSLAEEELWDHVHDLLGVALDEHGDDPLLLVWAGLAAQRVGEEGEAYEFFRRTLALEPEDPFVLATAGRDRKSVV